MTQDKALEPAEPGTLVRSAAAVETELGELERLTTALGQFELDSQEQLAGAGRSLADAFACHARAVEQMRALGGAVAEAHQRQKERAAVLEQTAQRLQQRGAEFAELTAELMGLGEETRKIALMLQALLPGSEPAGTKPKDFTLRLEQALLRLDACVERARLLRERARAVGIGDIAQQAEALASQIAAAGEKLRAPADAKRA